MLGGLDRGDALKPSASFGAFSHLLNGVSQCLAGGRADDDPTKPVPNSSVPSTRHRKTGNKDVFENVFKSEQQMETSIGTFCNMTIADGLISLFHQNGIVRRKLGLAGISFSVCALTFAGL